MIKKIFRCVMKGIDYIMAKVEDHLNAKAEVQIQAIKSVENVVVGTGKVTVKIGKVMHSDLKQLIKSVVDSTKAPFKAATKSRENMMCAGMLFAGVSVILIYKASTMPKGVV